MGDDEVASQDSVQSVPDENADQVYDTIVTHQLPASQNAMSPEKSTSPAPPSRQAIKEQKKKDKEQKKREEKEKKAQEKMEKERRETEKKERKKKEKEEKTKKKAAFQNTRSPQGGRGTCSCRVSL